MKRKLLFLVLPLSLLLIWGSSAFGQIGSYYTFSESSGTYSEITGGTVSSASGDDGAEAGIAIGFNFDYVGTTYTTVTVGVNGAISFTSTNIDYINNLASTDADNLDYVAPLWDDMYARTEDSYEIMYETSGTSPNQTFTVQWKNISWRNATKTVNFQIVLYEGSNNIVFNYGTNNSDESRTASIGLNVAPGGSGNFISVTPGSPATTSTTTSNNGISSADYPGDGHIYTFTYAPPSCPDPSNQVETNITVTSADLGWTESGSATTWDIEWGVTGFTQGSGTVVSTTNNPYTLSGLSSATTYDWYVRADCGGGQSGWTGPSTFTTNASAVTTYPWNEGFENAGNIPAGWSNEYESGTYDWTYVDGASSGHPAAAHSGSYNANFNGSTGSVTKLVTLPLDLSSLTSPQLTFWHAQAVWSGDQDELRVYYKTSSTGTWTMIPGAEWTGDIPDWTKETFILPSPSSDYYIAFEGTDSYGYGVVVDDVNVEEEPSCLAPSAQTETNITSTSADLGWTENGGATTWNIEWGASGFTQGSGTMITGTTTNPYTLSGLTAETDYDWYVQTDCGSGSTSSWTGPSSFFTGYCTPAPISVDGNGITNVTFSTVNNTTGAEPGNYGDYSAMIGDVQSTATIPIDITFETGYTYVTKIWIDWNDNLDFNDAGDEVYSGVSESANPTTLSASFVVPGSASLGNHRMRIGSADTGPPTPCYTGSFGSYEDYTVNVTAPPACPAPSAQTETNITTTSADLGWTEGGSATAWNIEYGPTGFIQGNGTTEAAGTNPYPLSGLTANTTYDWYVQSDCGSDWIGPSTFTTACDATSIPYFQNFDAETAPDFPFCMVVENTNGDGNTWETNTTNFSAPNSARIRYNSSLDMDDWFFTQGLQLTAGTTYEVSFAYAAGSSSSYPENLAVDWGNAANAAAMSGTPIFDQTGILNGWYAGNGSFTPATSGTYYVGFHGYSDADMLYLYVDDIKVIEAVAATSWAGTVDNDWDTPGNWSSGLPASTTDVTIPTGLSNYPTVATITTIGSLLVESDATGDASVLNDGLLIVSGDATVQRYITGGMWHDVSASTNGQTLHSLYFQGNPKVWLRVFNEVDNTRTYISSLSESMDPGAGFEMWMETGNNETVEFIGALQRADITLTTASTPPISYTGPEPLGYNLIGNPFASPLDLDQGGWGLTDVSTSFWVWDPAISAYKDWNTATVTGSLTDGIIPMGQGFFIQTTGVSPSITIPMDARVHSSQSFYKNADVDENEDIPVHIALRALMNNGFDEMNVAFVKDATETFDTYDTRKFFAFDGDAPQVYSVQYDDQLSINGLPPLGEESVDVNVGYQAGVNGDQVLEAKLEYLPETDVFLEDLLTGTVQSLVDEPIYRFKSDIGDDPNRFVLHFNPLVTGFQDSENENQISIYSFDNSLYIRSYGTTSNESKQIWVYDMMGRTAIHTTAEASTLTSIPVHHLNGYVVVKVMSESGVKTTKIFIK